MDPLIAGNKNKKELCLEAADILRLVASHLFENGLQEACHALYQESGVGMAGVTHAVHSNLKSWAARGEWGNILEALSVLDKAHVIKRQQQGANLEVLLADVHEMSVLELAEAGNIRLAYATMRLIEDDLDNLAALTEHEPPTSSTGSKTKTNEYVLSRKRDLEQRLAALVSLRSMQADAVDSSVDPSKLPPNFYGAGTSKQQRREDVGTRLMESIPVVPPSRLTSLLQQAIKFQAFTGVLPRIKNLWEDDEGLLDDETNNNSNNMKQNNDTDDNDKRHRKRKRKIFDLVLGEVEIDPVNVGDIPPDDAAPLDPIPSKPYTTIKFGKKATAESAIFAPDTIDNDTATKTTIFSTSFSLVTGSSDGLVELYDAHNKYSTLRMDLPYQEKDELIGHDGDSSVLALAASNDGTLLATGGSQGEVKIWRISTGKCLRRIAAHDKGSAISCLAFSPDGSHILTGSQDSNCREFGLRTSRMLNEFHGHSSYIHSCQYVIRKGGHQLAVVTSSADGTVRIWNAKTSEVIRVLRPVSLGDSLTTVGASLVVDHRSDLTAGAGGCPAIHTVLELHTPADTMIIVPRGLRAFLVDFHGIVLRTFEDDTSAGGKVFVTATVSPSNHWLYCVTEDGVCCIFDIVRGKMEKSIRSFAEETTSKAREGSGRAEISAIIHHPRKGIIAAFSNDKSQKKGQLVLWK